MWMCTFIIVMLLGKFGYSLKIAKSYASRKWRNNQPDLYLMNDGRKVFEVCWTVHENRLDFFRDCCFGVHQDPTCYSWLRTRLLFDFSFSLACLLFLPLALENSGHYAGDASIRWVGVIRATKICKTNDIKWMTQSIDNSMTG